MKTLFEQKLPDMLSELISKVEGLEEGWLSQSNEGRSFSEDGPLMQSIQGEASDEGMLSGEGMLHEVVQEIHKLLAEFHSASQDSESSLFAPLREGTEKQLEASIQVVIC